MKTEGPTAQLPECVSDTCRKKLRQVGKLVAKARTKKGWSQRKLGRISGGSRTYISNIERGISNFTIAYISELADALNIKFDDLFNTTRVVVKFRNPDYARVHTKLQELLERDPLEIQNIEYVLDGFLAMPVRK